MLGVKRDPFPADGEAEVARLPFSCPGSHPDVKVEGDLPLIVGFSDRGVRSHEVGVIYQDVGYVLEAHAAAFV